MPFGEEVGNYFLRIVWEVILHSFFYATGWVVIKVFTLGRGSCSDQVTTLIGIVTWIALVVGFFLIG